MSSIEDQIRSVQSAENMLRTQYGILVQRGEMTVELARRHMTAIGAAVKTLSWVSEHRDCLREVAKKRAATERERHLFENHPVVLAILEAFPGARIVEINEIDPKAVATSLMQATPDELSAAETALMEDAT